MIPGVGDACVGARYPGPHELPGGSVLRDDKDRSLQYMEYGTGPLRWISLRDERYKYNYYFGGGREELFDMLNDPHESVNLLATQPDDAVAQVRNRLRSRLTAHERKWGLQNYATPGGLIELKAPRVSGARNGQFPMFPEVLTDEAEKQAMNDFGDEVLQAVRDEPLVKLHERDLESWEKNGAARQLIERIKAMA